MRRYGADFESTIVPGNDAGLRMTMSAVVPPCTPNPDGLFWFSDLTADFTETIGVTSACWPILALAKVTGETCQAVTWTWEWFPTTGTGGAPGVIENGSELCVYSLADIVSGWLNVSASCGGSSFGPILLYIESCILLPT